MAIATSSMSAPPPPPRHHYRQPGEAPRGPTWSESGLWGLTATYTNKFIICSSRTLALDSKLHYMGAYP